MSTHALPHQLAWRLGPEREGMEIAFVHEGARGLHIDGRTVAVQDGHGYAVRYHLELDPDGRTRHAVVTTFADADAEERMTTLDHDGDGHWRVDGLPAAQLAGCEDLDLEASTLTVGLPVRRLRPAVGDEVTAVTVVVPVRAARPERRERTYRREDDHMSRARYVRDGADELACDVDGFVVEAPGLASRLL